GFLIMPRMTSTLRENYENLNDEDDETVVNIFKMVLQGLIDLHATGYRHRDLSPSNIFFKDNKALIGDFDTLTDDPSSNVLWGTRGFMSPGTFLYSYFFTSRGDSC